MQARRHNSSLAMELPTPGGSTTATTLSPFPDEDADGDVDGDFGDDDGRESPSSASEENAAAATGHHRRRRRRSRRTVRPDATEATSPEPLVEPMEFAEAVVRSHEEEDGGDRRSRKRTRRRHDQERL